MAMASRVLAAATMVVVLAGRIAATTGAAAGACSSKDPRCATASCTSSLAIQHACRCGCVGATVCNTDYPECAASDDVAESDICRSMGDEYDHNADNRQTTEWPHNITCAADEYVTCDRIQFGALDGPLDVQLLQSAEYNAVNQSCYHLEGERIQQFLPASHAGAAAGSALNALNFRVRCSDLPDRGDDDADENAGLCAYTVFIRCECRSRTAATAPPSTSAIRPSPPPKPVPTPPETHQGCSSRYHWDRGTCGSTFRDVCGAGQNRRGTYSMECPDGSHIELKHIEFSASFGQIEVNATSHGQLLDLYTQQGPTTCYHHCVYVNNSDHCQDLDHAVDSEPMIDNSRSHTLSHVEFTVGCAGGSRCTFAPFIRYKCSATSTGSPTEFPQKHTVTKKKDTVGVYVVTTVAIFVLVVVVALLGNTAMQRHNQAKLRHQNHGMGDDDDIILMSGLVDDDDLEYRVGVGQIDRNIQLTGTSDDAVWRPNSVTGTPIAGTPGSTPIATASSAGKARRFDSQTGLPLNDSPVGTPGISKLELLPEDPDMGTPGGGSSTDSNSTATTPWRFDPKTGEPLTADAAATPSSAATVETTLDGSDDSDDEPLVFDTAALDPRGLVKGDGMLTPVAASAASTPFFTPRSSTGDTPASSAIAGGWEGTPFGTPTGGGTPGPRRFDPKTGMPLIDLAPVAKASPLGKVAPTGAPAGAADVVPPTPVAPVIAAPDGSTFTRMTEHPQHGHGHHDNRAGPHNHNSRPNSRPNSKYD